MAAPADVAAACQKACAGGNAYAKGGARGSLMDTIIFDNSWAAREPAHRLFAKIAGNILAQPAEAKFRKLNLAKIMEKFGNFVGIAELLRSVGFVADGANLVLADGAPLDALCQALCAWNEREARSAAARAEAERVRAENMKDVEATKAAKEANRAALKSLGEQARKDVAVKPINASVGNAIKFGATQKALPTPPPAPKGG